MKEVKLTKGKIALVDDEDFEKLILYKWHANLIEGHWYAYRTISKDKTIESMHSFILKIKGIDHINNNGLDNRKENLRGCTQTQNNANMKKQANTSSKYKGVSLFKRDNKWRAKIDCNYICHHLGLYDSEESAALAYNKKAIELFGEFARLN